MIIPIVFAAMTVFAISGAYAGVSYTELMGTLVKSSDRRAFFVRRQVITVLGLGASALVTRFLLGAVDFPRGYALLFGLAAGFLLIATGASGSCANPPPTRRPCPPRASSKPSNRPPP